MPINLKKFTLLYRVLLSTCFIIWAFSLQTKAQNISNEGTDFWVCFPAHVPSPDQYGYRWATMSVFITSKSNSTGEVSCGSFSEDFSVAANTVIEVKVPRVNSYIENGTGVNANKAIRVKVDEGQPQVVVYAHVFAGARSAASLVLPVEALGDKYYAIAYDQSPTVQDGGRDLGKIDVFSQFNVVAVEPNTTLKVTPVAGGKKQTPFSVTLDNAGDVYQYQNQEDVTGSIVEVDQSVSPCKKVAVFSGSSAVEIVPSCNSSGKSSSDPLFQQLYPIESWGKTYALVPFYDREKGSVYRFLAKEDGTIINYDGNTISLNEGEFSTVGPTYNPQIVSSNKPITVAQYALTQYCSDERNQMISDHQPIPGDPDMVILNPLEYSIDAITLYSSTKLDIEEQYINVTIPREKAASFRLNNVNYGNRFKPMPGDAKFSYAQIALHTIGGSNFNLVADTGFNAVAYGFGAHESYAYSAGTNLASTKTINALKQGTDLVIRNACVNDAFDFKLLLPYEALKIVWKIDADPEMEMLALNPKQIQSGDRTLYEYKLNANKTFTTDGVKKITVMAVPPPSANVCSVTEEDVVTYDLEINTLPVADFTYPALACKDNEVQFTYKELNIGKRVISWLWDFGDGTVSTARDPKHIYTQAGTYKVRLIINNEPGCASDVKEHEIVITERFTVDMEMPSEACEKEEIAFADKTVYPDGLAKTWLWNFGDQATSTAQHPTHTYQSKGIYQVSLTVTNAAGCVETYQQQIVIHELPQITFDNEQSCVNDTVHFQAKVLSGEVASWEWDFGDGSNNLAEKYKEQPQHRYSATGNYMIRLKASSPQGCVTVFEKEIVISGSNPSPSFEVLNANALCGDYPVQFKNTSTLGFGVITRLEWMFDYGNGQRVMLVDTQPEADKIYEHQYPKSGQDRTYQVVLRAYSGAVCYMESEPLEVVVKGVPLLSLNMSTTVCINAGPFQLDASNASLVPGTASIVGQGVMDGVFYPDVAGLGSHQITYAFLTDAGCTDTLKRTIQVLDIPELVEFNAFNVLLDGEKKLDLALAKGSNVRYQWYPSEGLSADNILNPVASPKETTKYVLTLASGDECLQAYEILVNVHVDPMIPNAFSPNGDGYNDTWSIKYLETFVNADIRIFNRYGQEVFYSRRYTDAWDGKFNSQDVPVGVYYYIIEPNNGRNKYTGSITLIR